MKRSACIEMLFTEEPDFGMRIALAKTAGFDAIEFWHWSNKDIDAIEEQIDRHDISVAGFVAEPMISLIDPINHDQFLRGLARSTEVAQRLKAPFLYIQSGLPVEEMTAAQMFDSICKCLTRAADQLQGSGVTLLPEPVSDSPGCYLQDNMLGFDIIERVDRAEIRLLYDFNHANVLGQDWRAHLPRMHLAAHIHIADHPGRGAPGTGTLPIDEFTSALAHVGYGGMVGYEHH